MNCASCGRVNRAESRFCVGCGRALAPRCPACGVESEPDAQFCGACGAALVAPRPRAAEKAEARKVVTIVFADLIGSTALHERLDPESVRRVMERYHGAVRVPVEAHGGTVVQLLGDGVMCAFGVPHVGEDDAIRAVRAAVGIQQAFRDFAREHAEVVGSIGLRVAVNTGEVVVSDDYAAGIGDPLNVAARLQQEARDGDVVIGESTERLVRDRVTLEPFGVFQLKGRTERVAAYRVVSLDRPAGVAATPFVGRDDELRRIAAVYDAAVAAPAARLVVILGSPGLGKSRLLDELGRGLGGATVLRAQCEAAGGNTFAPLARALRTLLRVDDSGAGEDLRAAIAAAVPGDDSDRARVSEGIAALLAATPALPEETFFVVRRFLAALAAARPMVLAIDDLQWAEPLLLDLIEHLVQWGSGVPLLVLAAARPDLRDRRSSLAIPGGLVSDVVTLAGLDAAAATRLAADVVGAAVLPAAVAGRVLATSEGNPLFVTELVRMLINDGALKREGDRWVATVDLAALEMPPTIHALLAARIERLGAEDRLVLERAAVVGRQFSRAAVAHLLPGEISDLDARLEALRRSELIEPDAGWFLGEPALRFHHGLTRDAAYRRVLKGTRAELHGRCAQWIEGRVGETVEHDEMIGWHLEQAHQHLRELGPIDARGRAVGERAARYLAAAGRRALARDDVPVAASLLGRAIDRLEAADPARADLALDWCEALLAAGDVGPAAKAIDELGRFAEGTRDEGRGTREEEELPIPSNSFLVPRPSPLAPRPLPLLRLQAWHTCFTGQLAVLTDPQALHGTAAAVAAAAQKLTEAGDAAGEAKAHLVHALALSRLGRIGACEAELDKALAAARRANDRRRSNTVLANAPLAALWGPSPVTRASGRCLDVVRVLRITQEAPAVEAVALRCQAVLEALRGRAEAARRMIASSRRMVEELGNTQGLLENEFFAGLIELFEGDTSAAEHSLRAAYEGLRSHGLGIDAARAAALLGRTLLAQGRAAEAEALSHESEALAGDDLQAAITWRRVRAEALARRGEHAAAVNLARAAVDIAAATDALLHHADARLGLAVALRAAGRQGEAAAEEARATELWEAKGATVLADRTRLRPEAFGGRARSGPGRIVEVDQTPGGRVASARPAHRRVGANDATTQAARLVAAIAAGNADAISTLLADDLTVVHHPTGVDYDREGLLVSIRSHLRAREPTYQLEPLATLGSSLALFRQLVSSLPRDELDIGAAERAGITLIEVDSQGRNRHTEYFAADRLGDAVVRLYERYADLLPEGPARERAAATARSVAALLGPYDIDRWAPALAPDIDFVDHRTLGYGSARGAAAILRGVRSLLELADDVTNRIDDVLAARSDAVLLRQTNLGTERAGGGAYERPYLQLLAFDPDGHVTRWEWFDADREAEAVARFDELVVRLPAARPTRRRLRPNAATAHAARLSAAVAARDAAALPALIADEAEVVHHPTHSVYEGKEALRAWRAMIEAREGTLAFEPLATLGDSLALCRQWMAAGGAVGEKFDIGPYEVEIIALLEVDEQGRRRRSEFFAPDRLSDAVARLYERYAELLPDGPERARAAATALSLAALDGALDLDRWAAAIAPDVAYADHRTLGLAPTRGAAPFLRGLGSLLEVADDVANRIDDVLALRSDAVLLRQMNFGTERAGGGAYERPFLMVRVFGADGLLARLELFDLGHDDEALARFDELAADPPAARLVRRRLRANAATATAARADAAIAARDVDAFLATWAEGAELIDHPARVSYGLRELGDTWRRALLRAPDLEQRREDMATLGERLGLFRQWIHASASAGGRFDVGDYEIGQLFLNEVDEQGRHRRSERFAVDRLCDAITRLYERHAELLPEGSERARAAATARSVAAMMPVMDPDRCAGAFAPGIESVDHRILGTWSAHGAEAVLQHLRSVLDLSNDYGARDDDILALRPDAFLVQRTTFGTLRGGGGAFERPYLGLFVFGADGLVTRWEQFDVACEDEALARFALAAEPPPRPGRRRVRPNAATANAARVDAAIDAQDVDAFPTLWADESETVGHGTRTTWGRQGSLAAWRSMLRVRDAKSRHEPLATLGDSLALCRWSTSGSGFAGRNFDVGAYEREEITLVEVDAQARRRRTEAFPVDRLGDAVVRLYERYAELLPDGPERSRIAATARSVAAQVGPLDLDRMVSAVSLDCEWLDRRIVGFGTAHGAQEFRDAVRTLFEAADNVANRAHDVLGLRADALLIHFINSGTQRVGGGAYERAFLMLWILGADGLVTRMEQFDVGHEAEALARFDELTKPATMSARTGRTEEGSASDPLTALAKPNAATVARDRAEAAFEARDWALLRALCAVDAKFEDRRRHALVSVDLDGWIAERQRWARSDAHHERRPHGTAGDRVSLERVLVASGPAGGRSELEYLSLTAVDDGERIVAGVVFDLDDWRAAYREAWARWFAADAAAAAVMAPIFESAEGWNDHDPARVRNIFADSAVVDDRRRAGMGLLEGADTYVEALSPLWKLAPDVQIEPRFLLALEHHGMVSAGRIFGTFPEGGPFESQLVWLFLFAGGRITRLEIFEIEDAGAALARFEDLHPEPVP